MGAEPRPQSSGAFVAVNRTELTDDPAHVAMLTVERLIAAPPEAVWEVLVDLDVWPLWGPSIRRAELDGQSPELAQGSAGRVWTLVGVPLPFVITEFEAGRSWAWTVAGVPATRHRVDPVDDGCRICFDVPRWAPGYRPVCAIALRRIEKLVCG